MTACESEKIIEIDGSPVSYRRIGKGKRKIFFFHGFPGSSAQIELFRPHLDAFDLDVICADRPGYHRSRAGSAGQFDQATGSAKRILADAGWESFEAFSVSGGTPFLFPVVRSFQDRVSRVTVVSGLAPLTSAGFEGILGTKSLLALRALPLVPGTWLRKAVSVRSDDGKTDRSELLRWFLPISRPDEIAMGEALARDILAQALAEAFMQNGVGPKRDARLYLSPWRLDLGAYAGAIDVWHGKEDRILPPAMAERVSRALPRAKLRMIEAEGHYSLALNHIEEILAAGR